VIVGYFEIKPLLYLRQRQIESALQEDGHLSAGDGTIGTVIATSTTRSDALRDKLFNESSSEPIGRDIGENGPGGNRGRVGRTILGTQEEDSHLSPSDSAVGTVIAIAAARGDAFGDHLLDPGSGEGIGGDIGEDGPRGSGGRVGRAMNAAEEEDSHLSTGDGIVGAVVEGIGGATASDAGRIDGFDLSPGKAIKRYICKDLCFLKGPDITVGATGAGDPILRSVTYRSGSAGRIIPSIDGRRALNP
jgi:hypothetical protein